MADTADSKSVGRNTVRVRPPLPAQKNKMETENCKHPPTRLFCWFVGDILCICCCECGAVLRGGAEG